MESQVTYFDDFPVELIFEILKYIESPNVMQTIGSMGWVIMYYNFETLFRMEYPGVYNDIKKVIEDDTTLNARGGDRWRMLLIYFRILYQKLTLGERANIKVDQVLLLEKKGKQHLILYRSLFSKLYPDDYNRIRYVETSSSWILTQIDKDEIEYYNYQYLEEKSSIRWDYLLKFYLYVYDKTFNKNYSDVFFIKPLMELIFDNIMDQRLGGHIWNIIMDRPELKQLVDKHFPLEPDTPDNE